MANGRGVTLLAASPLVLALAACGGSSNEGGGEGSCAVRVDYADVTYTDVAEMPSKPGELLGQGIQLGCKDSNGDASDDEKVQVFRVDGLDPDVAVASGASREETRLLRVEKGSNVPAEISGWLSQHK